MQKMNSIKNLFILKNRIYTHKKTRNETKSIPKKKKSKYQLRILENLFRKIRKPSRMDISLACIILFNLKLKNLVYNLKKLGNGLIIKEENVKKIIIEIYLLFHLLLYNIQHQYHHLIHLNIMIIYQNILNHQYKMLIIIIILNHKKIKMIKLIKNYKIQLIIHIKI